MSVGLQYVMLAFLVMSELLLLLTSFVSPISLIHSIRRLSYLYENNNSAAPQTTSDPLQNILYDSGIYQDRNSNGGTSTPPPHSSFDRERKPSIDIFLSQSPSKALGEDAFRVMNRTASNPALVNLYQDGTKNNNGGGNNQCLPGLKPLASTAPSSRSESPNTVRSSMGSASSPYQNRQQIPQQPHLIQQQQQQQLYSTQFATATTNGQQQSYGAVQMQQPTNLAGQYVHNTQQPAAQAPQYVPMQVPQPQAAQSQVFFMAVAGPDGKQVLQPVQMVQMPGQPQAFVMPAGQQMVQPQVMASSSSGQGVQQQQQQPVMLMQTVQGSTGMGNVGSAPLYQDNSTSGTNGGSKQFYSNDVGGNGYDNNRYQDNDNLDRGSGNDASGSLSNLYSSPHRPPLRSLLGNVRRLSRDQVGCRLLQQALDEDGPSAATAILNEGLTFWAEAMVDPFGNYLFQKILERITPEERVILVKSVSTRLVNASLNLHGTRSVQKIVEVCSVDEEVREEAEAAAAAAQENGEEDKKEEDGKDKPKQSKKQDTAAKILTDALEPSAARLCIDSHGNHAIQRILLKLPYQYTQFIFDAVAASVEDVARHRHGCCVIQRCLDSRHSMARSHLVTRIVEKSLELMQDAYGNYVVQYVLDVCGDDEVHAICESVIGRVCLLAIQVRMILSS